MAISEFQRQRLEKRLTEYCERRVPPHVRDQLRLEFRIGPREVELYEVRPRFDNPAEWSEGPVAKFRWVASHDEWRLFCQHRDLRWHEYERRFTAPDFDTLLAEVDRDPTGIFWGSRLIRRLTRLSELRPGNPPGSLGDGRGRLQSYLRPSVVSIVPWPRQNGARGVVSVPGEEALETMAGEPVQFVHAAGLPRHRDFKDGLCQTNGQVGGVQEDSFSGSWRSRSVCLLGHMVVPLGGGVQSIECSSRARSL